MQALIKTIQDMKNTWVRSPAIGAELAAAMVLLNNLGCLVWPGVWNDLEPAELRDCECATSFLFPFLCLSILLRSADSCVSRALCSLTNAVAIRAADSGQAR